MGKWTCRCCAPEVVWLEGCGEWERLWPCVWEYYGHGCRCALLLDRVYGMYARSTMRRQVKGAEGGEERGGEQETTTRGGCEVKRRVTKRSGSSIQTNNACFRRVALARSRLDHHCTLLARFHSANVACFDSRASTSIEGTAQFTNMREKRVPCDTTRRNSTTPTETPRSTCLRKPIAATDARVSGSYRIAGQGSS